MTPIASLVLIRRTTDDGAEEVLLARKKKVTSAIGFGLYNGPGGMMELVDEGSIERCAVRETREELGLTLFPDRLKRVAELTAYAGGVAYLHIVVFETNCFKGEVRETAEMQPAWFPVGELPFRHMLESDEHWMPDVLTGVTMQARLHFTKKAQGFTGLEFLGFLKPPA